MSGVDDLRGLMSSPYDPDPQPEGGSAGGAGRWLAPVAAAVVGLGLAFGLVALTGEDAPQPDPDEVGPVTSLGPGTEIVFEQAEGFPAGYTPIDETVAVRPLAVFETDGRTYVSFASAVIAGEDQRTASMRSIADWWIEGPGGRIDAYRQSTDGTAPGTLTLGVEGVADPTRSTLVVVPAASSSSARITLLEDAAIEQLITEPITVEVAGATIVIDRLFYNDVWGHFSWHSVDGVPATVQVVVSFLGTEGIVNDTDLPLRVHSFHTASVFFDIDGPYEVPEWGVSGQETLDRHGPIAYDETTVESVLVEVLVSVAEVGSESIEIPLVDLVAEG